MTDTNRKWDRLSAEQRQVAMDELIAFFAHERDEKIGIVAAGQLLDHFMQSVGSELYNKGSLMPRVPLKLASRS